MMMMMMMMMIVVVVVVNFYTQHIEHAQKSEDVSGQRCDNPI